MTREEAVKVIRSWDFLSGDEIEALETLVPEYRENDGKGQELNEAAIKYADMNCRHNYVENETDRNELLYAFIAGAEWQKEKDARDMYMSDNRHFQKVYELGKKDMRKEMMKKAVEIEVKEDAGGYPIVPLEAKQKEVDFEKELREYMSSDENNPYDWDWRDKRDCARHFYELGLNSKK